SIGRIVTHMALPAGIGWIPTGRTSRAITFIREDLLVGGIVNRTRSRNEGRWSSPTGADGTQRRQPPRGGRRRLNRLSVSDRAWRQVCPTGSVAQERIN